MRTSDANHAMLCHSIRCRQWSFCLASVILNQNITRCSSFLLFLPPVFIIYPISISYTCITLNMSHLLVARSGNDAIHANGDHFVNGAAADIAITTHGSDWYWVCQPRCLIDGHSDFHRLFAPSCSPPPSSSQASPLPSLALTACSITLQLPLPWSLPSPILPWVPILVRLVSSLNSCAPTAKFLAIFVRSFTSVISIGEFVLVTAHRITADIFRVITTPLLLMDLLLTAGLPWPTILYTVLIDEIMIITGLIGALVTSSYKVCWKSPPML